MTTQFSTGHKSAIRGIGFSPLNKLLLASVGLDKNIVFYDINDKIIVKRIKTETPLQSVSFCTDGHTIAVGASNYGAILVYDLRKSSKEVWKVCSGHKSTINSIKFTHKVPSSKSSAKEGSGATSSKRVKGTAEKTESKTKTLD